MARVLIVGCGCRGRELAGALRERGHAVRGTSRTEEGRQAMEEAGVDGVIADPDRLGTLLRALEGVSAVCWLMAGAQGDRSALQALHGPRLQSMLDKVVDTPVRGVVYEARGTVAPDLLEQGAAIAHAAAATYRMPVRLLEADPTRKEEWVGAAAEAVEAVLAG